MEGNLNNGINFLKLAMAVKKKPKSGSKRWPVKLPQMKVKKLGGLSRLLIMLSGIFGIVYLSSVGTQVWHTVWPVKQVVLSNQTEYVKQQDLVKFIQQQSIKGMLAIDLQKLQEEAKKINWVKSVEVRKVWPDKLIFSIEESIPLVRFNDFVLTQQGHFIKPEKKDLKLDFLARVKYVDDSKNMSEHEATFIWKEFKTMKRKLEVVKLELENLNIDQSKNWHLMLANGVELNLGRQQRLERVERLIEVYSLIENKQQISKIDLRYHNGLAVKWQQQQTTQLKG